MKLFDVKAEVGGVFIMLSIFFLVMVAGIVLDILAASKNRPPDCVAGKPVPQHGCVVKIE